MICARRQAALAAAAPEERDDLENTIIILGEDTEATEFAATFGLDRDGRVRLLDLCIAAGCTGADAEDLPPGPDGPS